jgi:hypothetical protein
MSDDVFREMCDVWMHPGLQYFMEGSSEERETRWHKLFVTLIDQSRNETISLRQQKSEIQYMLSVATLTDASQLCNVVVQAIKHNHVPAVHLLLDKYKLLAAPPCSATLFKAAIFHQRSHFLRLFTGLWKFDIQTSEVEQMLHECKDRASERECLVLLEMLR